jgi:hypothetical protein
MKQSKTWVMATLGVLALSACGTPKNSPVVTTDTTPIDETNNGGGDGGSSRIPTGPTGPLTGNVDFNLSKSDAKLLRSIIEGLSAGKGPAAILGGIVGLGKALSPELNNGQRPCDAGGNYNSTSTGGDADKDGIPVSAVVTFSNCGYTFTTGGKSGKVVLNGKLELEDHSPNSDDNSFLFVAALRASGQGALDIGGTVINLNTNGAKLDLGLDIMNKSNSYDIAFGVNLGIDGKTLAARLDANIRPDNIHDYGAGGALSLHGKVGYSEPGSDTVVGFSSDGVTYDRNCSSSINHGSLTVTDGVHNLVITQQKCGSTSAKVDGHTIDL